mmetsp:Transcript_59090/g.93567  ORF Transcript_59090/g.93567 Transcript_59090/m.93567 type:complete len:246 (-) Transcript_59090:102-839(-)
MMTSDAKVVATECTEAQLTSGSAEHQKFAGDTGDKFSSPFAFSQAGPELAASASPMTAMYVAAGPGPPPESFQQGHVEVTHVMWQQTMPMQQMPQMAPGGMPPGAMPLMPGMPAMTQGVPPMAAGLAPGLVVEGWLSKRAQDMGKTWMNRWFALHHDGVLCYGKEQHSQDLKKIVLDKLTKVRPLIHPTATEEGRRIGVKKPFGIEIYQGAGRRTWYLDAGSKEKRDVWLNSLQMVIVQTGGGGY